jgi:dimethylargininase
MLIAITRAVSPAIARCELTHLARQPIDVDTARRQHELYEEALRRAGCEVVRLPAGDDMPDAVFVEDTAVVFDEVAIITRPGAASRRSETAAVAEALAGYRPIVRIAAPGTLDGGDVLTIGRRVLVGESSRTNAAGIRQLAECVGPHGYTAMAIPMTQVLHLKSAVTAVDADTLLVNPAWVNLQRLEAPAVIDVHPQEPYGANALRVGASVIYPIMFPFTRDRLASHGIRVEPVDVSELAKAEGAVTCCSLIFDA